MRKNLIHLKRNNLTTASPVHIIIIIYFYAHRGYSLRIFNLNTLFGIVFLNTITCLNCSVKQNTFTVCLGNIDCIDFQSVHWKYKLDRLSVSVGNTDLSKLLVLQVNFTCLLPNPIQVPQWNKPCNWFLSYEVAPTF